MPKRVLLRGGDVLTMDPGLGDVHGGDVLIEDDRIAAVGHGLDVGDAETIECDGCIVIPGFIDSHRHTWETVIRGIAPDVSLGGYFDVVLDQLAPAYRPEDVYAGNYLGSLEAIDAGVTTLLDWSHINNTPEHSDEAIRGLADARLRAVYCYGNPNTTPRRLVVHEHAPLARGHPPRARPVLLERRPACSRSRWARVAPASARTRSSGTTGSSPATSERRSASTSAWAPTPDGSPWSSNSSELDLLDPGTTYIHCNYLSDDEFRLIASSGGKVSIAPSVEMIMGHGTPPTARALAHGLRPSLSIDVVTTVPGDMFTQMRFLFASDRLLVARGGLRRRAARQEPELLTSRQVLEFATIEGARVCGLEDRTGSLTPGKQADVVLIRGDDTNTYPVIDPVSTVVLQADTRNVDTVLVAGEPLKRDGQLVGADLRRARDEARSSLDYLLRHTTVQPHWVQRARSVPR